MLLLFLSIASLFIGFFLHHYLLDKPDTPALFLIEAFVQSFILCIVFLEVLPDSVAELGWFAFIWLVLGFVSIGFSEWFSHSKWKNIGLIGLGAGLGTHALIDGAALGLNVFNADLDFLFLSLAVIVHRLPVGIILGIGKETEKKALPLIIIIALATVAGFFGVKIAKISWLFPLQAFAGGVLGHVIIEHSLTKTKNVLGYLSGTLLGSVTFFLLDIEHGHDHAEHSFLHAETLFVFLLLGLLNIRMYYRKNKSD